MYTVKTLPTVDRLLDKLSKRNPKQFEIIWKKVSEIIKNPNRYKNLRSPMNDVKRVHIDSHFVLLFSVNEAEKVVVLENYKHHKKIYK